MNQVKLKRPYSEKFDCDFKGHMERYMYEPPIKINRNVDTMLEDAVCEAILRVGIDVDKEELIKALKYDRQQYDKGYADGYVEAISEFNARIEAYNKALKELRPIPIRSDITLRGDIDI